jgi:hypothetical protein
LPARPESARFADIAAPPSFDADAPVAWIGIIMPGHDLAIQRLGLPLV